MDISAILNMVKKAGNIRQVRGRKLTKTLLADLYAGVELDRLPVGEIFVSSSVEGALKKLLGDNLRFSTNVLVYGTEEIRYIGTAWGADYYVSDEVPEREIIAVTTPGLLREALAKGRGTAKLVLAHTISRYDVIEIDKGEDGYT